MSYRFCTEVPALWPALAPITVPPSKPPPAPTAAPVAGLPEAAPIAAPTAAPTAVPTAAPPIVLSVAALPGVVPVCMPAHWRHDTSSPWNCSKVLPLPGSTMTLGPVGTDAHAPTRTVATVVRTAAPTTLLPPLTAASPGPLPTPRGKSGHSDSRP